MKLFRYIAVILLVTCGTAHGSSDGNNETDTNKNDDATGAMIADVVGPAAAAGVY